MAIMLHPRIEEGFPDFALIKQRVAFCGLVKANNSFNQTRLLPYAAEHVLSFE